MVQYAARGEVFSKASREMLEDVEVTIYEIDGKGQRRFLKKVVSANGHYDFPVEPSRKYSLEATKDGFFAASYDFDSNDYTNYTDFGAPLYMEPYGVGGGDEDGSVKEDVKKLAEKETVKEPVKEAVAKKETPKKETLKPEAPKKEVVTTTTTKNKATKAAPITTGTYYKIQIIALKSVDMGHSRFANVKNMRRIDKEFFTDRKLYRVMLADYATLEEAQADLPSVRAMKDFSDAFIVEYKDGVRGETKNK